jgi:hypothetical protein
VDLGHRPGAGDRSTAVTVLNSGTWGALVAEHAARADGLTAAHRSRRARGETHPVEDFLFTYYSTKPSLLRRWHPGVGVVLEPGAAGPAPNASWRWYTTDRQGAVALDADAYLADRATAVAFVHRLLVATASRPAFTGCFGLHEWAMVYRADATRHPAPLRLGPAGTDAVVESHPLRCTHVDAFRFFTPDAAPLNRLQPTRQTQVAMEQPGCLHASMDCHKWATKLGPVVPGALALDCFTLAGEVRRLDMQASPYDLTAHGHEPVAVETPAGKAEYVERQQALAQRAGVLRQRLVAVCAPLLQRAGTPAP